MRVLLVEDDDTIADPLIEGLGRYGFAVTRVVTGAAALEAPHGDPADCAQPKTVLVEQPAPVPEAVGLLVDRRARQVWLHGRPVVLSPKEFAVVALLDEERGAVVPRQRLIEQVWGPRFFGAGRTLDFHVASVRRKLGDPGWVETRRGVGFRLAVPGPVSPPAR